MNPVQPIHLIQTTLTTRGDGNLTPIRQITQWWTMAGDLIAEKDPCSVIVTEEQRRALNSIFGSLGLNAEEHAILITRVAGVLDHPPV